MGYCPGVIVHGGYCPEGYCPGVIVRGLLSGGLLSCYLQLGIKLLFMGKFISINPASISTQELHVIKFLFSSSVISLCQFCALLYIIVH